MKLTVLSLNKTAGKDGVFYSNLSFQIPDNVHALQWESDLSAGWIEFKLNIDGTIPPNESITVLPDWAVTASSDWDQADYEAKNPPPPTDAELIALCKDQARVYLEDTDWSEIPSVVDTTSPQYLVNAQEFVQYRIQIRNYVINPVTNPVWPTVPTAQWSS